MPAAHGVGAVADIVEDTVADDVAMRDDVDAKEFAAVSLPAGDAV